LLECPTCRSSGLVAEDGALACPSCAARYGIENGIASFHPGRDAYTENYDQIAADDLVEPKTPSIVKEIFVELVLERVRGVVCDLGCGDGYVIRRVPSDRRIAVDIARAYLERIPPEILRLWSGVEDVPLASGSVDTIVCTDVIEHVLDATTVAREIDRLCAPDGRILLAFPFEQDLGVYDLPEYKAKYGKYAFVHLRSIGDAMIAELFPGFEVVAERLITEGMHLMEFRPFAIKFVELRRR
jgi:SAM-dependent methyltransferase